MRQLIKRRDFMKSVGAASVAFGLSEKGRSQAARGGPHYRNPALPVEQRVADLLGRMRLEEKVAQVKCPGFLERGLRDEKDNFSEEKARQLTKDGLGGILVISGPTYKPGKPSESARFINAFQKFLRDHTRLGIPVLVVGEGLHGFVGPDATTFPQAIALASTWDPDLVHRVFTVAAAQARAAGTHHFNTPLLDVARQPRWGRTEESYGEDPYLVACVGVTAIKALQGPGPAIDKQHVIAAVKRFAGYGQPEGGRNIAPANVSVRTFREFILSTFRAGIMQARARADMPSYNEVDGVPSHAKQWLLQKILREKWRFPGYAISDFAAVEHLIDEHHVASTPEDATRLALEAGIDIEISPDCKCYTTLAQQVRDGRIAEATLTVQWAACCAPSSCSGYWMIRMSMLILQTRYAASRATASWRSRRRKRPSFC